MYGEKEEEEEERSNATVHMQDVCVTSQLSPIGGEVDMGAPHTDGLPPRGTRQVPRGAAGRYWGNHLLHDREDDAEGGRTLGNGGMSELPVVRETGVRNRRSD